MGIHPVIGALVVLVGAAFMALAAVGLLRMPDPYNRIQAATKGSTLGVVLALVGLALYEPTWLPKLLVIALFVLLTSPISSHALARAAHAAGVPLTPDSVLDELATLPADDADAAPAADDPSTPVEEAKA